MIILVVLKQLLMNYKEAEAIVLRHNSKLQDEKFFMIGEQKYRFLRLIIAPENQNKAMEMYEDVQLGSDKDYLINLHFIYVMRIKYHRMRIK